MKSAIVSILFFMMLMLNASAQQVKFKINYKNAAVKIMDWMYPLTQSDLAEINDTSSNELPVKFRIVLPNKEIEPSNFTIFINEELAESAKAGEVSLTKIKRTFENTYQTKLRLQPGENLIKAMYLPANSADTLWSPSKKIVYENGKAGFDNPPEEKSRATNYIYWLHPDITALNNNAIVQKQQNLVAKIKIITTESSLTKDRIVVYHNNSILKTSSKSTLKRTGKDEYVFKEYFQLTEKPNPNFIYVDFKTEKRTYRTKATLKAQFSDKKPNLYVLSIGTSTNLKYTEDDAYDFAGLFDNQKGDGKLFSEAKTNILVGTGAEAANIKKSIEKLKTKFSNKIITENDVIILFLSSHGFVENDDLRLQGSDFTPSARLSTSLSYKNDILNLLDELPCKKLVFLDACHSGASGSKASIENVNYHIEKLNQLKEGTTIIASSQKEEQSYEDKAWQNGAFTEAIVDGLKNGKADLTVKGNQNGIITIDELFEYLKSEVPAMVGQIKNEAQHPIMTSNELQNVAIYIY